MHRITPLTDTISLLKELTAELEKHREEIQRDEILALQKETRQRIKVLKEQLDALFPASRLAGTTSCVTE